MTRSGIGASVGASVTLAVGLTIAASAGTSVGASTSVAAGATAGLAIGVGSSPGPSTSVAVSQATAIGVGSSAGTSTTAAVGQAGRWPESVRFDPTIVDDAWGGALTYAWTQVSGPATATIDAATARATTVFFDAVPGVYVFELAVSRTDDALVGRGLVRVRVYTDATLPDPARDRTNPWPMTLTAGGVAKRVRINSCRIADQVNGASTCDLAMVGDPIAVGDDVVVTRHSVALFGGVCLSLQITRDAKGNVQYAPSCTGYAWHFGRRRVTQTYTNTSISVIAAALLADAPGGISGAGIQAGLPAITIAFADVTHADALTALTRQLYGLTWRVDASRVLHLARTAPAGDPTALTPAHPSLQALTVTRSLTLVANRVRVSYTLPASSPTAPRPGGGTAAIVGPVVDGATELQVASLRGYDSGGGSFLLNGGTVTYGGTATRYPDQIYGLVSFGYTSAIAVEASGGELGEQAYELENPGVTPPLPGTFRALFNVPSYYLSLSTSDGETPLVQSLSGPGYFLDGDLWQDNTSPTLITQNGGSSFVWPASIFTNVHAITVHQNAVDVCVLGITANGGALNRITAINIYRQSTEPSHAGDSSGQIFLVGSLSPRGGIFRDLVGKAKLAPIIEPATAYTRRADGSYPWDPPATYWLTGCSGVVAVDASPADPAPTGNGTGQSPSFVTVDDVAAQRALATLLGGSDDGVIELPIAGGTITEAQAVALGQAYLASVVAVQTSLACTVADDAAQPGQVLDLNMPAPFGTASAPIQRTTLSGFEDKVPHTIAVEAATVLVTLDQILQRVAP